jgi:transcriptional regulator with XRE-family HTH domain
VAVEGLRKLVERTGRSARALTEAAGVPQNRLAYWLRPDTVVRRMPTVSQMEEIAGILNDADPVPPVSLVEVSRAFAAAFGLVLDDISEDEFALVVAYRRLSERDQHTLRTMREGELELIVTVRQLCKRDRRTLTTMARALQDE